MKPGSTSKPPRPLTRLATGALVIGILLLNNPAAPPETSRLPLHDEPVEAETLEGLGELGAALVFYRGTSSEAPLYVLADVAVDEDFVEQDVRHVGRRGRF